MGAEDALARRGVLVTCGSVFVLSGGVSEGDTEAGGLTGVVLAPGALGCGQGGGPLSAPISWQLFFRNVWLPVLGLRVFPVGSFAVAGTI